MDIVEEIEPGTITKNGDRGDWIQTWGGGLFYPLDPQPEEIHIEDIAHALSLICRFNGHCDGFYSVAQHSIMIACMASPENALWGLLHDAAECYVADMPRPVKRCIPGYKEIEAGVELAVAQKFGLPEIMPPEIKELDHAMLALEANTVLKVPPKDWYLPFPAPENVRIKRCWTPKDGEILFKNAFALITESHSEDPLSTIRPFVLGQL
jgi:hypothetical protein